MPSQAGGATLGRRGVPRSSSTAPVARAHASEQKWRAELLRQCLRLRISSRAASKRPPHRLELRARAPASRPRASGCVSAPRRISSNRAQRFVDRRRPAVHRREHVSEALGLLGPGRPRLVRSARPARDPRALRRPRPPRSGASRRGSAREPARLRRRAPRRPESPRRARAERPRRSTPVCGGPVEPQVGERDAASAATRARLQLAALDRLGEDRVRALQLAGSLSARPSVGSSSRRRGSSDGSRAAARSSRLAAACDVAARDRAPARLRRGAPRPARRAPALARRPARAPRAQRYACSRW